MWGLTSSDGWQGPSQLEFNCRLPTGSHTSSVGSHDIILRSWNYTRAFHSPKAHELPNTSRRKLATLLLEIQALITLPRSKAAPQTTLFSITNHNVSGGAYHTSEHNAYSAECVCECVCMSVCVCLCVHACVCARARARVSVPKTLCTSSG